MAETTFEAILVSVQIVILSILLILMVRRRIKYKIKPLNWLLATFAFGLIEAIIDLSLYIIEKYGNSGVGQLQKINIIPFGLAIFTLYMIQWLIFLIYKKKLMIHTFRNYKRRSPLIL